MTNKPNTEIKIAYLGKGSFVVDIQHVGRFKKENYHEQVTSCDTDNLFELLKEHCNKQCPFSISCSGSAIVLPDSIFSTK